MTREAMPYLLLALVGVLVSAISQVILKKSANKHYDSFIAEYLNPYVIVAYSLFVGATLLSTIAFKAIPLSMGPIIDATGYFYVTLFGLTIFHEHMSKKKFIALLVIIAGIIIYATGL